MRLKLKKNDRITFDNKKTFVSYHDTEAYIKGHIIEFNEVPLNVKLGVGLEYEKAIAQAIRKVQRSCAICRAIMVLDPTQECIHELKVIIHKPEPSKKNWSGDQWNEHYAKSDWDQYLKEKTHEFNEKTKLK